MKKVIFFDFVHFEKDQEKVDCNISAKNKASS